MHNLPAPSVLLFGASGRLGGLCADVLRARRIDYAGLLRCGDIVSEGRCIGNLYRGELADGRFVVIDASIDHGTLDDMVRHEDAKLEFLSLLERRGALAGLLAFSSGVVEFDDADIRTEWHRCYKALKLRVEARVAAVDCPACCLRPFAVIGPRCFALASTGWVDIVLQAIQGGRIGIGAPDEQRSYVAEAFLAGVIERFLDGASVERIVSAVNGAFSLGEIARFVAKTLGREITIEARTVPGWLAVPYVTRAPWKLADEYHLEAVLAPLLATRLTPPAAGCVASLPVAPSGAIPTFSNIKVSR